MFKSRSLFKKFANYLINKHIPFYWQSLQNYFAIRWQTQEFSNRKGEATKNVQKH
uniref:Uncharacterized protein n=1 Tax=Arundo donax TaxID=35708 RepID=A0A0A9FU93_ARUDO